MSATMILDRLAAAGVSARPDPEHPDRLRLAPPNRLDRALLELVKRNKPALLAALRERTRGRTEPLRRFSAPDRADFERIAAALRAELANRPQLAGIAAYRPVLEPQTGAGLTAIISARRHADGTITISEIAGDWTEPTLPDLETWTPQGAPQ